MHTFCIGAVFRNESHILDEWIRHYLDRGADHIYLVNDFSTDNFSDKILPFGNKITLFHSDIVTKELGKQVQIYEKFFRSILNSTKWFGILDLDEFLYSPETKDISRILENYNEYSAITIDWQSFGSSGHISQPKSVVEGFRMRAKFDTTKYYYSYKTIFKAKKLKQFSIHNQFVSGPIIHLHYTEESGSPLIINHYPIQSLDFFMKVKATRGDLDNYIETTDRRRDLTYFNSYDLNVIKDDHLYIQNSSQ
jgi:hypothetical protein